MRVIKVVRRVAERIHLQLGEQVLRQLLQQPVEDQAALDGALRVQDEDDLGVARVVQLLLDDLVPDAHVLSRVAPVALDQAFDDVEEDAGAGGVSTNS